MGGEGFWVRIPAGSRRDLNSSDMFSSFGVLKKFSISSKVMSLNDFSKKCTGISTADIIPYKSLKLREKDSGRLPPKL
jgi:hypothetical protein